MQLTFVKMNGLGNDFVMVEDLAGALEFSADAVAWLCDRHFGIGADGLIVVRPATTANADYYMHYYNADGSVAEMCGNGARCFAKYLVDHGLVPADADSLVIETLGGLKPVTFVRDASGRMETATIDMGEPVLTPADIPTALAGTLIKDHPLTTPAGEVLITAVSMGNPHAIIWVDDVDLAPVETVGPLIEHHAAFPRQTNVEFAQVIDAHTIRLRVWERGVGETLACGTGACATAVAGVLAGLTDREVTIELPGGDLAIRWDANGRVYMTGSAATSFTGAVEMGEDA